MGGKRALTFKRSTTSRGRCLKQSVSMTSEDLAMKPAEASICTSINWMRGHNKFAETAEQKAPL